jgi:hypothetical protein
MRHPFALTAITLAVACAANAPRPEDKPVVAPPPTIATSDPPVGEPPTRDTSSGSPFAPSPLTELATALTKLASTVLDGNPPPRGPIPIEALRRDRKLIDSSGPPPQSADLEFLAFGIEMMVMFHEGTDPNISAGSPGPPPPPEDGAVEATLLLGKTGIKIVELHLRSGKKSQKLPGWLAGASPVGNDLADAARRGKLDAMLVGESERSVLGNDKLFQMALKERPKPERVREVEAAAKKYPRTLGVEIDELYLLAKSRSGAIFVFEFNIDEDDGQIVLDAAPLFSVERRDPDDRMGHPVDGPGPPPPRP